MYAVDDSSTKASSGKQRQTDGQDYYGSRPGHTVTADTLNQ